MMNAQQTSSSNGALPINKLILGIFATVIGAGVIGVWQMSYNVARLEERVASWGTIILKRMDKIEEWQREQDRNLVKMQNDLFRNTNRLDTLQDQHKRSLNNNPAPH